MCECGCVMNGERFRLKGPKGITYMIRLMTGCEYCDIGPSVDIVAVPKGSVFEMELEGTDDLPMIDWPDNAKACTIICGLRRHELEAAVVKVVDGYETGSRKLDEIDGETIGEELWPELYRASPSIPKKDLSA